ncbi:MAG: gliding motility-associated C-terminal domain-containing protein, partial [Bacteroidota bacterium]
PTGVLDENGSDLELMDLDELDEGVYSVSVIIDGCESPKSDPFIIDFLRAPDANQDEFNVEFETELQGNVLANDVLDPNASFTVSIITDVANGTLVNNGDGSFSYTPDNTYSGTDEFSYEVCYDGCESLCAINIVKLEVIFDDPDCNTIHNLVTPNGDGVNDNFVIPCLDSNLFPASSVSIYNEWGDRVFTASPYQNNFDGKFNGKNLPDGTYYYIFQRDPNNNDVKRGFITLQR